jgi:hypothetical protein
MKFEFEKVNKDLFGINELEALKLYCLYGKSIIQRVPLNQISHFRIFRIF